MGTGEYDNESPNSCPKVEPLPGSIHMEYRRCGTPTCRCAAGRQHGPYYVRRWWAGGRQHKTYVRGEQVVDALVATAAWRALMPSATMMTKTMMRRVAR